MAQLVSSSQITLVDLNDAIIKGTPPENPWPGALWIDTSVTPHVLKSWVVGGVDNLGIPTQGDWLVQSLNLAGLDPKQNQKINDSSGTLADMASDAHITQQERVILREKLNLITGLELTPDSSLPSLAEVEDIKAGEIYNTLLEARNAGLPTSHPNYSGYENSYLSLRSYLSDINPKPWDIESTGSSVIFASMWISRWTGYYESLLKLRATIAEILKENIDKVEDESRQTRRYRVRYIRDWLNGSTANTGNHWVEIKAMAGAANRAAGRPVTSSIAGSNLTRITDNDLNSANHASVGSGLQWVQIDLGSVFQDIDRIQVWHFYSDSRSYFNTKTEVSENGVDWITLFDSSVTGTYSETVAGNTVIVNPGAAVDRIRDDLRIVSALPTSITMDSNGITATVSGNPNQFARLDHRGLYIQGGAIQIQHGLPASQIDPVVVNNASAGAQAKQDIDNLEIGGRNLVRRNLFPGDVFRAERINQPGEVGLKIEGPSITETIVANQEYTISMIARGNARVVLYLISNSGNLSLNWLNPSGLSEQEFKRFSFTFTSHRPELTALYIYTAWRANPYTEWFEILRDSIKVEKGNMATDWTPSPEDVQAYTWIKYAPNGNPTNAQISDNPTNMTHMGIAYNKTVETASNVASDYTWSLIKGDKGDTGEGARVLDLVSTSQIMTFTSAGAANPSSQTISFTANLQNLTGTAVFTATPFNSAGTALTAITLGGSGNTRTLTSAQWPSTAVRVAVTATLSGVSDTTSVVQVRDGATGSTGATGSAGTDAIVGFLTNESITLPANSSGTVSSFATATGTFEVYQGLTRRTGSNITYAKTAESGCTASINATTGVYSITAMSADSATATYTATFSGTTLTKVVTLAKSRAGATGATGPQGIQGPAGADGTSQHVHIRYSANSNGSSMTTTPQANTTHIGIAITSSGTAPSVNTSYTWSLFRGADGAQGIQGPAGANGVTTYTWVRYADTDTGVGISSSADGKRYIGLSFNRTSATPSNTASDYTWSPLYDNVEVGGRNYFHKAVAINNLTNNPIINREHSDAPNGFRISGRQNLICSARMPNVIDGNGWWTVSFWGKANGASTMRMDICDLGHTNMAFTTTWQRFSFSVNVTNFSAAAFNFVDFENIQWINYDFKDFKLEKGNIATDWSPAPEDTVQVSQDYNGVIINGEDGIKVTSTRNTLLLNASKGIEIVKNSGGAKVFELNSTTGDLSITGNINMTGGSITWGGNGVTAPTAAQVGARPSNWLPTPADIGAETPGGAATKANEAEARAKEVAIAMSSGRMVYTDPTFLSGNNDVKIYNNSGGTGVTFNRIARPADAPTTSSHILEFTHSTAATSPNHGGFSFQIASRANAVFIVKFIAKIATNMTFNWASNAIGTGGTTKWLTSNQGTGKYEEYIYKVECGSTGTFSTTVFFSIAGGTRPFTWQLAYATVFDTTDADLASTWSFGNTTEINGSSIRTGTVTANKIDAKGLTVTDNNNRETFKIDNIGNVTVNGTFRIGRESTMFSPTDDFLFDNGPSFWFENHGATTPLVATTLAGQGSNGGNLIEITGMKWAFYGKPMPIDTNKPYRVRFRVRQMANPTSGGAQVFAGVAAYDANMNPLTTTFHGSHRYCAVSATTITVANGWRQYEGIISGEGNDGSDQFIPGTKYAVPMFIINFNNGNGRAQVDICSLEDLSLEKDVLTKIDNLEYTVYNPRDYMRTLANTDTFADIMEQNMSTKIDMRLLPTLATIDALEQLRDEAQSNLNEAISSIDFSPYPNRGDLELAIVNNNRALQDSGGGNLLRNSLGHAGYDFWSRNSAVGQTIFSGEELRTIGFGSGFRFSPSASIKTLSQEVSVVVGREYSLSWYVNKANSSASNGDLTIIIYERNASGTWTNMRQFVYPGTQTTAGFQSDWLTYRATTSSFLVEIRGATACEAVTTGLMLNVGSIPVPWSFSSGEIYNRNMILNRNGLKITHLDSLSGEDSGFTEITTERMAIHYDENGNGLTEKVFSVEQDETYAKKLTMDEMTMGNIRVININSGGRNGWAFVPTR